MSIAISLLFSSMSHFLFSSMAIAAPDEVFKAAKVLGVEVSASQDEIHRAYRKLTKKHHPDRGSDGEMMRELNLAYEALSKWKKFQNAESERERIRHLAKKHNIGFTGFGDGEWILPYVKFGEEVEEALKSGSREFLLSHISQFAQSSLIPGSLVDPPEVVRLRVFVAAFKRVAPSNFTHEILQALVNVADDRFRELSLSLFNSEYEHVWEYKEEFATFLSNLKTANGTSLALGKYRFPVDELLREMEPFLWRQVREGKEPLLSSLLWSIINRDTSSGASQEADARALAFAEGLLLANVKGATKHSAILVALFGHSKILPEKGKQRLLPLAFELFEPNQTSLSGYEFTSWLSPTPSSLLLRAVLLKNETVTLEQIAGWSDEFYVTLTDSVKVTHELARLAKGALAVEDPAKRLDWLRSNVGPDAVALHDHWLKIARNFRCAAAFRSTPESL